MMWAGANWTMLSKHYNQWSFYEVYLYGNHVEKLKVWKHKMWKKYDIDRWWEKLKKITEWQLWVKKKEKKKLSGRRATVTEIYKCYNSARPIVPVNAQNCQTLKWLCYSSRGSQQVLFMPAKNWTQIMHRVIKAHTISNWFHKYDNGFSVLQWPPGTRFQSNRAALGCGGTADSQH